MNVHYCLHLLACVATVCLMLSGEAAPLIFLLMSAGWLQSLSPSARSPRRRRQHRLCSEFQRTVRFEAGFRVNLALSFPKRGGRERGPPFVFDPAPAALCCSPSALQFSLSLPARGRAGDFISVRKLESFHQLCILMYGQSLRSHPILRGVS